MREQGAGGAVHEDLVVSLRNRKALFAKSGVDVSAERTKLRKELALDVGGATDPGTPGLTWAADTATAAAAPLGNVARTQALGPFSLFARSGDGIDFDAKTGGVRFACNSLMVGACYKRAIVGGAFEVPAGMKRGLLRVQLGVNASVSTVAFLAYANAEVKLTAFVGDVTSPSCKVEQRIVQSVAPVFGVGARRFDRDVWLACPFDASTPGRRAFSVQTETWAGSGGVGSAASALVASAYGNAAVDFSPSAF